MKIAYILPSLRNQGPIIVAKNLVDYLVEWGHVVDVYYFDEFSSAMTFKCPTKQITMKQAIDFDRYDIVHSHCLRPDMYLYKWRKHIHKPKLISTLHQDTFRTLRYKYNLIYSYIVTKYWCYLYSKFDGVVSISNQLKNTYEKQISTPMTTIYNGCAINVDGKVDENIVSDILKLKVKYKVLGTYAYITRRKGLNQVLSVLPSLNDFAFVIIGEGPDVEHLKQMSCMLGISDRVLFFPYQKNPSNYLSYFDVYVMPSYSEGFGMAMVEAALAGKSIVCSNLPSFHEIFSKTEVSFFELDNIESLQDAVLRAFGEKEQKGTLARIKSVKDFSVERMVKNYLQYYELLF